MRTCQQLLNEANSLWTFLEIEGIEPTNNAAERALRQSVIQRKIIHGVQSASGAVCRSRLLTVTTTLRQHGRDVWQFLEQAWIAHHGGGMMPSLLPDRCVQQKEQPCVSAYSAMSVLACRDMAAGPAPLRVC